MSLFTPLSLNWLSVTWKKKIKRENKFTGTRFWTFWADITLCLFLWSENRSTPNLSFCNMSKIGCKGICNYLCYNIYNIQYKILYNIQSSWLTSFSSNPANTSSLSKICKPQGCAVTNIMHLQWQSFVRWIIVLCERVDSGVAHGGQRCFHDYSFPEQVSVFLSASWVDCSTQVEAKQKEESE